jgi:hypothetical protein
LIFLYFFFICRYGFLCDHLHVLINILISCTHILLYIHKTYTYFLIDGVIVSMLALSTVDRVKTKTKTLLSLVSKYRIPTYGLVSLNFHYTYSVKNYIRIDNLITFSKWEKKRSCNFSHQDTNKIYKNDVLLSVGIFFIFFTFQVL